MAEMDCFQTHGVSHSYTGSIICCILSVSTLHVQASWGPCVASILAERGKSCIYYLFSVCFFNASHVLEENKDVEFNVKRSAWWFMLILHCNVVMLK